MRRAVFVQDVEHKGFERHFLSHCFDVLFSSSSACFLERQEFFRCWIIRQGFSIQNDAVSLYLLGGSFKNFRTIPASLLTCSATSPISPSAEYSVKTCSAVV